jgi:hypothetical protein
MGYLILGRIIERAAGMSYEQQINPIVPNIEDGMRPLVIRTNGATSPRRCAIARLANTAHAHEQRISDPENNKCPENNK